MASTKAYLRIGNDGLGTVKIRYTHNRRSIFINTGIRIDPSRWDEKRQIIRMPHLSKIKDEAERRALKQKVDSDNSLISTMAAKIAHAANKLRLENIDPNIQQIKSIYYGNVDEVKKKSVTFKDRIAEYLESVKRAPSTKSQIKTIFNRLIFYLGTQKIEPSYQVFDDKDFYSNYKAHLERGLRSKKTENVKPPLNANTVGNHFKNLKAFLHWSQNEGYFEPNFPLKKFKVTNTPKANIALAEYEIGKFYNHKFESEYLEKVRDRFVLHCTLGLRVSDFKRFVANPKMYIRNNHVVMAQQKTSGKTGIPLTPLSHNILKKYDWQLPKLSDQKYNQYVKLAAKQAGINDEVEITKEINGKKIFTTLEKHELITTHVARKTFATLCHNSGIAIKKISLMMGLSVQTLLRHYIGVDLSGLEDEMQKVSGFDVQPEMKVS